jgi:hypothetical protein
MNHDPLIPDDLPHRPPLTKSGPHLDPVWEPLEAVLPFERCDRFMYMGESDGVHHYKQIDTRNYLRVDERGNAYRLSAQRLAPITLDEAIAHVFDMNARADGAEGFISTPGETEHPVGEM